MKSFEEWQRLQELFELTLHTPETQRESVLETAGAEPELKARIAQALLEVDDEQAA